MKKEHIRKTFVAAIVLTGFLLPGPALWAQGDEKHPEKKQKSPHMEAMYALKDKIPQGYRIMERTPIIPDPESIKRGKDLYTQQCALCHGNDGRGNGPAANGLKTPPANFLDRAHSSIYGPGEKYWIIGNGSGETGMPAFQNISPLERWHLVNYIYDLQASADEHTGHDHSH